MADTTTQAVVTETLATEVIPAEKVQAQPAEKVVLGKDGTPFDPERAMALIEKLQNENKELKPKAKLADELTAEQQKIKDAQMSELEKANKRALELEVELKAITRREMQRAAAEKAKLPMEFAERLRGETQEELEADAMKLLTVIPKAPALKTDVTNPGGGSQVTETREQKRERLKGTNSQIFSNDAKTGVVWPMQE